MTDTAENIEIKEAMIRILDELFLAFDAYFEAMGEPQTGRVAVAYVPLNRIKASLEQEAGNPRPGTRDARPGTGRPRWARTIYGVLDQDKQFSWHNSMTVNTAFDAIYKSPAEFGACLQVARKVFYSFNSKPETRDPELYVPDPTAEALPGGATHYHNPKKCSPKYFTWDMPHIVIGNHVFYRA